MYSDSKIEGEEILFIQPMEATSGSPFQKHSLEIDDLEEKNFNVPKAHTNTSTKKEVPVNTSKVPEIRKEETDLKIIINRFFRMLGIEDEELRARFSLFVDRNKKEAETLVSSRKKISLLFFRNFIQTQCIKILRKELSSNLEDPEYEKCVIENFSQMLADVDLSWASVEALLNWVVRNALFLSLGTALVDKFEKDLREDFISLGQKISERVLPAKAELESKKVKRALRNFLQQVANYDARLTKISPLPKLGGKRLMIIASKQGGGNYAQVRAMQPFLEKSGYEVSVVDLWDLTQFSDPILNYEITLEDGRKISLLKILIEWETQNRESELYHIAACWQKFLFEQFPDRYKNNSSEILLEKIRKEETDLIILTPANNPYLANVSFRAKCPMIVSHCDYYFWSKQFYLKQKGLPEEMQLVKFGIPDNRILSTSNEEDRNHASIAEIGFPIAENFEVYGDSKKNGPSVLEELRKKWNIPGGRRVYTISQGMRGMTKHLLPPVKRFLETTKHCEDLWEIIVICGANERIAKKFRKMTKDYPQEGKPFHFQIHTNLDADQMSEVFAITDINDFKAGGGTTAEFLAGFLAEGSCKRCVTTPHHYPQEEFNAKWLQDLGVGILLYPDDPNTPDIIDILQQFRNPPKLQIGTPDWRKALPETINQMIARFPR